MIRSDTKSKHQLNTAHKKHTLNINAKSRRLKMVYYTYTNQKKAGIRYMNNSPNRLHKEEYYLR